MKRTEKKLKSKGIKTYTPKARYYLCYKYNRAFVANHWGDATFVPFSRTSMAGDRWERDDHINHFLRHYLKRFFRKQVGKDANEVFNEFAHLGWKNSSDMYFYWNHFISPRHWYGYYINEDGKIDYNSRGSVHTRHKVKHNIDDDEEEKPKPIRRHASDKRLTRKHLDYNETIITKEIEKGGYGNAYPGELGEMYVELNHKVVKRKVHLVRTPHNPRIYSPITLLGLYKEERRFYHNSMSYKIVTKFNEKEQILEAEIIQDNSNSGELIPCI